MATFVWLHDRRCGLPVNINVEHIVSYMDRSSEPKEWQWTTIRTTCGSVEVTETGAEITELLMHGKITKRTF